MYTSKKKTWGFAAVFAMVVGIASTQEDSLQSALNAINRRQRDLSPGYRNFYSEGGLGRYYTIDDKDPFLKPENERTGLALDASEYPKENEFNGKDRFSSSFRERLDKNGESENFINRLGPETEKTNNDDFLDMVHRLYQKYYGRYPEFDEISSRQEMKKRGDYFEYYPTLSNLGYGSVGLKKRSKYFNQDEPNDYHLSSAPNEEFFSGIPEEKVDDFLNYYKWNLNPHLKNRQTSKLSSAYSIEKRFPLTKRSNPPLQEHKLDKSTRSLASTDPKVAKELSSIFSGSKTSSLNAVTKHDKINGLQREAPKKELNVSDTRNGQDKKDVATNESTAKTGETLQIKKKSIDWSDYFGYDRKKKFKDDNDNEWLMERYHKAIAMATKRKLEKPSQNLNHKEKEEQGDKPDKKNSPNDEETKLEEMDLKLKNIEDSIIDEALKYTGAHEGMTDSKEIQDIKDRVISRLAAAYSLEKMRQALGEYKTSIAKQRKKLQESGKLDNGSFYEEKRVSVPRKEAIDEERQRTVEPVNHIKCTHEEEDCEEQVYRPSGAILDQSYWTKGDCPQIEETCNEVADVLGIYGRTLEPACNIHQVCLFCGENNWFASTRKCNVFFLAKADELCDGNAECRRIANQSIRYLLDIYRSSQIEHRKECNLSCPINWR